MIRFNFIHDSDRFKQAACRISLVRVSRRLC